MKQIPHLGTAIVALAFPAAALTRAHVHGKETDADLLVQGARVGLQAYTRASDAYAHGFMTPSVALWSAGIAVALVLLEWLVSRPRR
jgi:hypothetical protein